MIHALFCIALSTTLQGQAEPAALGPTLVARALPSPPGQGAAGAALPNLTRTPDGRVLLSFVRREDKQSVLVFCELEGERWSTPREVARGADWFVNWADFPSVTAARDGGLLAHWLQVSGAANYAYDVRTSVSHDSGATWSDSALLHSDRQATEHGFVSVVPEGPDGWRALWLDGRQLAGGGPMALVSRGIAADGALGEETIVDERVCDCCGTSLIALPGGGFAGAWRDREGDGEEVRDVSFSRAVILDAADGAADGAAGVSFGAAKTVGSDHWLTRTCPVNGPRLAAESDRLALAWFTGAADKPRVNLAWSRAHSGAPDLALRVDGSVPGTALGRGDLAWIAEHSLSVGWLGLDAEPEPGDGPQAGGADATWWVRGYRFEGSQVQPGEPLALARVPSARRSGFLRMAPAGNGAVVVAWTAPTAGGDRRTEVSTALITPGPPAPGTPAGRNN